MHFLYFTFLVLHINLIKKENEEIDMGNKEFCDVCLTNTKTYSLITEKKYLKTV